MKKLAISKFKYFFAHFAVEIVSFFIVFSRLGDSEIFFYAALLYDCIAFVPQVFIGDFCDKHKNFNSGLVGSIILTAAIIIPFPVFSLLLVGIGNAIVHVALAEKTLCTEKGTLTPVSLFVAGGSFGVILGQILSAFKIIGLILSFVSAVFLIVLFIMDSAKRLPDEVPSGFNMARKGIDSWIILLLSFLTVSARSFASYAIPTFWVRGNVQKIILFSMMGMGKALGGVFADYFGARRTAVISLIIATPLLCLGSQNMIISVFGVLFFSMTMSISLGVILSVLSAPGFSFGITTLGLFIGTLPIFIYRFEGLFERNLITVILSVIAIISFWICASNDNIKV